jgi:hypothetical protein|tara:strand:- start:158 stop:406 length:249 start_codon:yes stop_codon:yes gene_type:complete
MINLSVSDPIDGFDKIGELRSAVGTDYCGDNQLVSVSKNGDRCTVRRNVVHDYINIVGKPSSVVSTKLVNEPSWLTWNRMFF